MRAKPADSQAFALVGPITTARHLLPILSAHTLTADGLANVTISADRANLKDSSVQTAGTVS